jgi:hypothetical protein
VALGVIWNPIGAVSSSLVASNAGLKNTKTSSLVLNPFYSGAEAQ